MLWRHLNNHGGFLMQWKDKQELIPPNSLIEAQRAIKMYYYYVLRGIFMPKASMNKLASQLREQGHSPQNIDGGFPLNIVFNELASAEETADRMAQKTGDKVPVVGHSLGGVIGGLLHTRRPDLIDRSVAISSPITPLLGSVSKELQVNIPPNEHATSIFTPWDVTVFWPLSVNGTYDTHQVVPYTTHQDIVNNSLTAQMVHTALTEPNRGDRLHVVREKKTNEVFVGGPPRRGVLYQAA